MYKEIKVGNVDKFEWLETLSTNTDPDRCSITYEVDFTLNGGTTVEGVNHVYDVQNTNRASFNHAYFDNTN